MTFDRSAYNREYYRRNKARIMAQNKEWALAHPDKVRKASREYHARKPDIALRAQKKAAKRAKETVMKAYGGEYPRCACCGQEGLDFLTLGHVNNDGEDHRRSTGKVGTGFYYWLIKNNFPNNPPLRVECWNCNMGARVAGGKCPHERSAPSVVPVARSATR